MKTESKMTLYIDEDTLARLREMCKGGLSAGIRGVITLTDFDRLEIAPVKYRQISFRIPERDRTAIRAAGIQHGITPGEVLRRAVKNYVNENENET